MVGVGRDLCGSPSPPPCRSRVTHSRLHRTLSRWVWNISREGDSTASLGSLYQCSVILRGKKFFLMFSWNFLCFSLCPLPLVLSLGTTGKSLAPSSWHPPCRYLEALVRSPLSLLFSRLKDSLGHGLCDTSPCTLNSHVSFLASLSVWDPIPVERQDLLLVEIIFCYWAPEGWRTGWCPLVNGSWLTPSPTAASSPAPAITTHFFPHLVFIYPLRTLQFICSLDFCLWICFLCLCPFVLAVGPHWKPSLNRTGSQGREKCLIFLYCFQSYHLKWAHLKKLV